MSSREKTYASLPLFDPTTGHVVLEPEAPGKGYWVGAPAVVWDADRESFLLCYRRRRPRGEASDRGYRVAVAESKDGLEFKDIFVLEKEELDTTSIEKTCIARGPSGEYLYYLSYVDPADQRWRTDVVRADSPESIDVKTRQEVFTANKASRFQKQRVEGVKDPNVYKIGGLYYMFLSCAENHSDHDVSDKDMHATSDVFNTGLLTAPSAWATSTDGISFRWRGRCLRVGDEGQWDSYQARLNSVFHHEGVWYGFYDGIQSHTQNYEEQFGLVQSLDLERWQKISERGPLITVPWQSGSVRYTEALRIGDKIYYYYEVTREDASHELRCSIVDL